MTSRIRLDTVGDLAVVVKSATTSDQRQQLELEARWLRRLRHPGVVQLVDLREQGEGAELVTRYAGSATLADLALADAGVVTAVMATVASVTGDLHGVGVSHRNLVAAHVILGSSRHPVLCSFAAAGAADEAGVAADLAALGTLTEWLLDRCPPPTSRLGRRQLRSANDALDRWRAEGGDATALARCLSAVAGPLSGDIALSEPPEAEPVAGHTGEAASSSEQRDGAAGTRPWRDRVPPLPSPDRSGPSGRRAALVAGSAAALVLIVVATGAIRGAGHTPATVAGPEPPTPIADITATAPPSSQVSASPEAPACVALVDDICVDDVAVDGNMIRVSDQWFQAGVPGDVIELGDWNCDGFVTPALLRPSTGDVFVFSQWARGAEIVEVVAVARATGAAGLSRRSLGTCDALHTVDVAGVPSAAPVVLR